jgi:hypothetical protein
MNVCDPPIGMSIGAFGIPMGWFVCGSVAWYMNIPGICPAGAIPQPVAIPEPMLIIVANAVVGVPTGTERLLGSTAATGGLIIDVAACSWIAGASSADTPPVLTAVASMATPTITLAVLITSSVFAFARVSGPGPSP